MNPTVSNIALLALGASALSAAIELAKSSNFIGAGIAVIVGVVAFYAYEKLPPSTLPPQ